MRGRQNDCFCRSVQQRHARGRKLPGKCTPHSLFAFAQSTSACPHGLHILTHAYRVPTQLKLVHVRKAKNGMAPHPSRCQGRQCAVFTGGLRDNTRKLIVLRDQLNLASNLNAQTCGMQTAFMGTHSMSARPRLAGWQAN